MTFSELFAPFVVCVVTLFWGGDDRSGRSRERQDLSISLLLSLYLSLSLSLALFLLNDTSPMIHLNVMMHLRMLQCRMALAQDWTKA